MNLLQRNPAKLTIDAFNNREMTDSSGSIKVMYNPDSIILSYHTEYIVDSFINNNQLSNRYAQTRPSGLTIELLYDKNMPGNNHSIDVQINNLRSLCYDSNPAKGEPRYLKIIWGRMSWNSQGYYAGRISKWSVRYTRFDPDGEPSRARVVLELIAEGSLELQSAVNRQQSPEDLVIQVPDATTLPQIVNSCSDSLYNGGDYMQVAEDNGLDTLDDIIPGQTIRISSKGGDKVNG